MYKKLRPNGLKVVLSFFSCLLKSLRLLYLQTWQLWCYNSMQILGLEVCAETLIGDNMRRGISGGQRKRVTTGKKIHPNLKTISFLNTWTC